MVSLPENPPKQSARAQSAEAAGGVFGTNTGPAAAGNGAPSSVACPLSSEEQAVDYARESAFLGLVPPRAEGLPDRLLDARGRPFGPALCKLTPWRHHLLLGYASPYVTGAPARRRHLWQVLYLCSAAFRAGSRLAFIGYQLRTFWFVTFHFQAASAALDRWLRAPFAFMPAMPSHAKDGTGAKPEAGTHWLITLQQVGRTAGFSPMEVLHLPYTVLWQTIEAVLTAKGGKDRPKFNRKLDRARGEYLRRRNASALNSQPSTFN